MSPARKPKAPADDRMWSIDGDVLVYREWRIPRWAIAGVRHETAVLSSGGAVIVSQLYTLHERAPNPQLPMPTAAELDELNAWIAGRPA